MVPTGSGPIPLSVRVRPSGLKSASASLRDGCATLDPGASADPLGRIRGREAPAHLRGIGPVQVKARPGQWGHPTRAGVMGVN